MKKSLLKKKLKEAIRPFVLSEITMESPPAGKVYTKSEELIKKIEKILNSVSNSTATVKHDSSNGKVFIDDGASGKDFRVEVSENGDLYDVTAFLDGSERVALKSITFEALEKLLKETLKGRTKDDSYVNKALKKNVIPDKKETPEKATDDDKSDTMKETENLKLKKQIDHKPIEPKDRSIEEVTKGTSGMKDSTKFKKQEDIKGKDKVKLKSEKKNASNEKLTQKLDGTSKLKALKESIKEIVREILKENRK